VVDVHIPTTNSHEDIIFLNFDDDPFLSELVDSITLSDEEDVQLLSVGILIEIGRQHIINFVMLFGNVNRLILLQHFINVQDFLNFVLKNLVLFFHILELL
jgi:hypothetical protein